MESRRSFVNRHYWSVPHPDGLFPRHASYTNQIHDEDDSVINGLNLHDKMIEEADIQDGDEYEVIYRKKDSNRFKDTVVVWTRAHTYTPVALDSTEAKRCGF